MKARTYVMTSLVALTMGACAYGSTRQRSSNIGSCPMVCTPYYNTKEKPSKPVNHDIPKPTPTLATIEEPSLDSMTAEEEPADCIDGCCKPPRRR